MIHRRSHFLSFSINLPPRLRPPYHRLPHQPNRFLHFPLRSLPVENEKNAQAASAPFAETIQAVFQSFKQSSGHPHAFTQRCAAPGPNQNTPTSYHAQFPAKTKRFCTVLQTFIEIVFIHDKSHFFNKPTIFNRMW